MNSKAKEREARAVAQAMAITDVKKELSESTKQLTSVSRTVTELAEDNVALIESLKRAIDGQESLRTAVVQALDQTQRRLSEDLQFQWLRNACRELSPVLHALEGMVTANTFADADATRQHANSLAVTLGGVFGRLGLERMPIRLGIDEFDSHIHDCVRVCTPEESPLPDALPQSIVFVQDHGYRVGGRVVVAAKVWVMKLKEEPVSGSEKGAAK